MARVEKASAEDAKFPILARVTFTISTAAYGSPQTNIEEIKPKGSSK